MRNLLVLAMACGWSALGCGNDRGAAVPDAAPGVDVRARMCPTAQSTDAIPQRLDAVAPTASWTFTELSAAVESACGSCHVTPQANGGFTYTSAYTGSSSAPGLAAVATKMATQLATQKMPPDNIRSSDPAYYLKLGERLQAWITAGSPETGTFPLPNETVGTGQQLPPAIAAAMTDIGDCVPLPEVVHQDPTLDTMFASATKLPMQLADTDLMSLDAYVLAQHGTVAYDVEYPLWADNAHKGRWVHVPTVVDAQGNVQRQSITFDSATGQFKIPDNTRFYKTFFKQVKESDGVVRYRKVETRLIVVRHAPAKSLFGTYVWDASEGSATLHTDPYRDGTPFKDRVLSLVTDVATGALRTYAIPGANRCNDCHQGSASDSFVLGFTPLQINRRAMGEAGRDTPTSADEMSQLARLVSYGVVSGVTPDSAPRLETSNATKQPRNIYELRFQAYAAGNCAHCHNPKGFAFAQGIRFNFAPGGDIFQFSISLSSVHSPGVIVRAGLTAQSYLYTRVSQPSHVESAEPVLHMPLHTPGIDCEAVNRAGKWITSIPNVVSNTTPTPSDIAAALDKADQFDSGCKPTDTITWLDEDFSDPPVYAPRRGDWNDQALGIPAPIRQLEFTDRLQTLASTPIPFAFWPDSVNGVACQFPTVSAPPGGILPWMLDADGNPKHPYGQLRYTTPGEKFFSDVCSKCHGVHGNADSYLAKSILALSGGEVRVANLHDGLVGMRAANLSTFDVMENGVPRNLAGNYLIWMASGGTKVTFPAGMEPIIGPNGGNMLFLVRQNCAHLLPGEALQAHDTSQGYEVLFQSCAFDNPITPDLGFAADGRTPLNPDLQKAWLDRAVRSVGWSIFYYLKTKLAVDDWAQPGCPTFP